MEKIKEFYNYHYSTTSDINEHLPVLLKYSQECSHITEMGVRTGVSSWAFLYSNPQKMISYDIGMNPTIQNIINIANVCGINYTFNMNDVLSIEIEPTELLFIDTWHSYNQLYLELSLHSKNVSKYIILHDTVSYGYNDESPYDGISEIMKSKEKNKEGLINAVNDFLLTNDGDNWLIHDVYTNNNGLTVLKRKN
jgi:hypothetical protein